MVLDGTPDGLVQAASLFCVGLLTISAVKFDSLVNTIFILPFRPHRRTTMTGHYSFLLTYFLSRPLLSKYPRSRLLTAMLTFSARVPALSICRALVTCNVDIHATP